ncbi:MAG TPA: 50S ribosomal protein L35 [Dehalococcoidales bacterium]|nr:50S ribosomal protein L35 [Dehalococcoidales bacterium]
MPKIKTHKGAASRFSVTGTGKLTRMKGGKSHLRIRKSKRVKRLYDSKVPVASVDAPRLKKLLPYGA